MADIASASPTIHNLIPKGGLELGSGLIGKSYISQSFTPTLHLDGIIWVALQMTPEQ
jgi:hypothetical protein